MRSVFLLLSFALLFSGCIPSQRQSGITVNTIECTQRCKRLIQQHNYKSIQQFRSCNANCPNEG